MKTQDYLKYNGKVVRNEGSVYKIIATTLGSNVLVGADCVVGPQKGVYVDLLKSRTPVSKTLRTNIGLNLVS